MGEGSLHMRQSTHFTLRKLGILVKASASLIPPSIPSWFEATLYKEGSMCELFQIWQVDKGGYPVGYVGWVASSPDALHVALGEGVADRVDGIERERSHSLPVDTAELVVVQAANDTQIRQVDKGVYPAGPICSSLQRLQRRVRQQHAEQLHPNRPDVLAVEVKLFYIIIPQKPHRHTPNLPGGGAGDRRKQQLKGRIAFAHDAAA